MLYFLPVWEDYPRNDINQDMKVTNQDKPRYESNLVFIQMKIEQCNWLSRQAIKTKFSRSKNKWKTYLKNILSVIILYIYIYNNSKELFNSTVLNNIKSNIITHWY